MIQSTHYELRIGDRVLAIQLPSHAIELRPNTIATDRTMQDWIESCLNEPLEFPPLPLAILDDDRIAIAVEDGVPEANAIICALVRYLVQHGTQQTLITVVLGSDNQDWRDRLLGELANDNLSEVRVVKHDPTNQESHGYVGASQSADPIYIQRDLFEAEVVLPIYCIRTPESPSASDKYGMSPSFANADTQHRWNLAWLEDNVQHLHLQEKLSHEAGWLMGVQFAIAVVPSSDGRVSAILGGNADHVFRQASELVRIESKPLNGNHSLVLAFVEGDRSQQSWMNIARAAAHADMQLDSQGSIVICSDIDHLSIGMQQLATDEQDEHLQRRLLKSDLEDAFAAAVISSIQGRRSVYLMSKIPASQIESLGLAFIENAEDIERLCASADGVCAMRSAQF